MDATDDNDNDDDDGSVLYTVWIHRQTLTERVYLVKRYISCKIQQQGRQVALISWLGALCHQVDTLVIVKVNERHCHRLLTLMFHCLCTERRSQPLWCTDRQWSTYTGMNASVTWPQCTGSKASITILFATGWLGGVVVRASDCDWKVDSLTCGHSIAG